MEVVHRHQAAATSGEAVPARPSTVTKADQIGMLATVMNCIYVSEIFRYVGMKTQILTPFECGTMTKLFSKDACYGVL